MLIKPIWFTIIASASVANAGPLGESFSPDFAAVLVRTAVEGHRPARLSEAERHALELPARMVWARYMSAPRIIELHAFEIFTLNDQPFEGYAFYDHDHDLIAVHLRNLAPLLEHMSLEEALWIVVAHEATHLVQRHCGEDMLASLTDDHELAAHYADDRHEREAWRESLDVFRAKFPTRGKALTVYGSEHVFPTTSSYPAVR